MNSKTIIFSSIALSCVTGFILGVGFSQMEKTTIKTTLPNGGYIYEHVKYPPCPDFLTRSVEIPERDEVDMLTVVCK